MKNIPDLDSKLSEISENIDRVIDFDDLKDVINDTMNLVQEYKSERERFGALFDKLHKCSIRLKKEYYE